MATKNLILAFLVITDLAIGFGFRSQTFAAKTVNIHNQHRTQAVKNIKPKAKAISATIAPDAGIAFSPNHLHIVATYFWVGETASTDNGQIPNKSSAWDELWQQHFGGVDDPLKRNGYLPAAFTPKENPFYIALPYNDVDANGNRKSTASLCPNSSLLANKPYSWCKNSWVVVRYQNKLAYAQWEDVGPFGEDDLNYVFGDSGSSNTRDTKAGLDVSPAVKSYLGLGDVSNTDWTFVSADKVPDGPWKNVVTTSLGDKL